MAASAPTPKDLQHIRDFAAQWGKIIARQAFGDAGPLLDADFQTLEQLAQAAAQGLLQGTLGTLLEQQAQTLPEQQPCPDCQTLCPVKCQSRPLEGRGAPSPTTNRSVIARPAAGLFFPLRPFAPDQPPLRS